jgi:toxin ParE1/3/4
LAAVNKSFRCIMRFPFIGGVWETDNPEFTSMRTWPIQGFENHLIFYRLSDAGIEIVRVLHGSRDLETIFGPAW